MVKQTKVKQEWALASFALRDAFTDFILSRRAMRCTDRTVQNYEYTLGRFLTWLEGQSVSGPEEITARHVRAYLAEFSKNSGYYQHSIARCIKTMLRFFFAEEYMAAQVSFDMPKIPKKKLRVLSVAELKQLLASCTTQNGLRDTALIRFIVDCGARKEELSKLTWSDVDIETGEVQILEGKGKKYRTVVIGIKTRRVLLKYRQVVHDRNGALFQTDEGTPLTLPGIRSLLVRVGNRAGIEGVSPQVLRRTFATLSIKPGEGKPGMGLFELQRLMGHSNIATTRKYVETLTDDLLEAHRQHGPVDRWGL